MRLVYGVASGDNTVAVRGATTAVTLPALIPVQSGDYCAVLEAGADRLIIGPVDGAWSSFTPTWNNVTLGTGATSTGKWRYYNGDLEFIATFVLGTGGSVTGNVSVDLPNSETSAAIRQVGGSILCSLSGANHPGGVFCGSSSTTANLYVGTNDVAASNPFTWAVGATLDLHARIVLDV